MPIYSYGRRYATGGPGPYVGLGDVLPGALHYWGVRSYSAATRGTRAINVQRNSDGQSTDIFTDVNSGSLVDPGDPLHPGLPFFDSSTQFRVRVAYDQTGNGGHLTGVTNPPVLILNSLNGGTQPLMRLDNSLGSGGYMNINSNILPSSMAAVPQPFSFATCVNKWSTQDLEGGYMGNNGNASIYFPALSLAGARYIVMTTDTMGGGAPQNPGGTHILFSNAVFHDVQGCFNGTTQSSICVDGATTTGTSVDGTLGLPANGMNWFNVSGISNVNSDATEFCLWSGDQSASYNALHSNQSAFFGIL